MNMFDLIFTKTYTAILKSLILRKKMLQGPNKKILIPGASLAAYLTGVGLERLGYNVTIVDPSVHSPLSKGVGMIVPHWLIEDAQKQDYLDSTFQHLPIQSRLLCRKSSDSIVSLLKTPVRFSAVNWADLYHNFRNRFTGNCIKGKKVTAVKYKKDQYCVSLESLATTKSEISCGMVIIANGRASTLRDQFFPALLPEHGPRYAGYVAWRGIMDTSGNELFNEQITTIVFPKGYLEITPVPAEDYETSEKIRWNWVLYEKRPACILGNPKEEITHLHQLLHEVLPASIASKLIEQTRAPYLEAITSFSVPQYFTGGNICTVGNAAAVFRPNNFTSFVPTYLNCTSLVTAMNPNLNKYHQLFTNIVDWDHAQRQVAREQNQLDILAAETLITNPPNWETVDISNSQYWQILMGKEIDSPAKKTAHITTTPVAVPASTTATLTDPVKKYTPLHDRNRDPISNLSTLVGQIKLDEPSFSSKPKLS